MKQMSGAILAAALLAVHPAARAQTADSRSAVVQTASRSSQALTAVRQALKADDLARARQMLPFVVSPDDYAVLLADKRAEAIWPDLEAAAGPHLEKAWTFELRDLETTWKGSGDYRAAAAYARGLCDRRQYSRVIELFAPLFEPKALRTDQPSLELVAAPLARALVAAGRRDDALNLLRRLTSAWPLEADPRGINIVSNLASQALSQLQYAEAVEVVDRAFALLPKHRLSADQPGFLGMQTVRVCALHRLGMDERALPAVQLIASKWQTSPSASLTMLQCLGRTEDARRLLMALLADEQGRDLALRFMQRRLEPESLPHALLLRPVADSLRSDPALLTEVAKYGRVLPFPLNEAATSPSSAP